MKAVGRYEISDLIGRGNFGEVRKCRDTQTDQIYASKIILKSRIGAHLIKLQGEVNLLMNKSHPYMIKLHDSLETANNYYLILDYIIGGDLSTLIKNKGPIPEIFVKKWIRQIIQCMEFLNEMKIVHRDLKPANILLTHSDYTQSDIKITDFDLSKELLIGESETLIGTPLYSAPEILRPGKHDYRVDVWSLGCMMYELLTARPFFDVRDHHQLIARQLRIKERGVEFENGCGVSEEAKEFIAYMLVYDKENRPFFRDLMNHSYIRFDQARPVENRLSSEAQPEESLSVEANEIFTHFLNEFQRNSALFDEGIDILSRKNVLEGHTLASLALREIDSQLYHLRNLLKERMINSTRFNNLILAIEQKLFSNREFLTSQDFRMSNIPNLGSGSDQILRLVSEKLQSSIAILNLARNQCPENSAILNLLSILSTS